VNLVKWEELPDVVLCDHSYAGCVITGVADQIAERIRALVFLDGFVLEKFKRVDQFRQAPESRAKTACRPTLMSLPPQGRGKLRESSVKPSLEAVCLARLRH
jgi:pimeloyl-ACP methyl ester carboxylesterase